MYAIVNIQFCYLKFTNIPEYEKHFKGLLIKIKVESRQT